jgi:16S rRNA (cytosine967-C5)-methyltransferase
MPAQICQKPGMIPPARVAAAIEVMADIEARRRPAADALKDWGLAHRFAGSGDRAAIASLVQDMLRRKASASWLMRESTPRAVAVGMLRLMRGLDTPAIRQLFDGSRHGPPVLTDEEESRLAGGLDDAPAHVRGDYPEWLAVSLQAAFGERAGEEGQALATRAPLDIRVNTLKTIRIKALPALVDQAATPGLYSPDSIRIPPREDGRIKPVQADPLFIKGMIEIQDEGSQIVARLAAPVAGEQALDLCAGGGGKSLAMAALMNNKGQIYASDSDPRRLAPIHERIERAGVRNVQVRTPRGGQARLDDLAGQMDLVFVDAPCTGTGTWRRNPDAKWRIRPGSLDVRLKEQREVLAEARRHVRPGGRLAYVTCSLLPEENDRQIEAFLGDSGGFEPVDALAGAAAAAMPGLASAAIRTSKGLMLTPLSTGTDGFYLSLLVRKR